MRAEQPSHIHVSDKAYNAGRYADLNFYVWGLLNWFPAFFLGRVDVRGTGLLIDFECFSATRLNVAVLA